MLITNEFWRIPPTDSATSTNIPETRAERASADSSGPHFQRNGAAHPNKDALLEAVYCRNMNEK